MLRFKDHEKDGDLPLRRYWKFSTFLRIISFMVLIYFLMEETGIYSAIFAFLVLLNMEGQFALNNYLLNANVLSALLHRLNSSSLASLTKVDELEDSCSESSEDIEEIESCCGFCDVCEICDNCSFWGSDKGSEVERSYCLACGTEVMTDSGQICKKCENKIK